MRWFFLALIASAAPAPAQDALPDKFFIECGNGDVLVFIDGPNKRYSFKKPDLQKADLHEDDDGLFFDIYHAIQGVVRWVK